MRSSKQEERLDMGHAQQRCFAQLRKSRTSAPVLALHNANRERTLSADACSYCLGAVLLQKQTYGELRPVAYASRAMSGVEATVCSNRKRSTGNHVGMRAVVVVEIFYLQHNIS